MTEELIVIGIDPASDPAAVCFLKLVKGKLELGGFEASMPWNIPDDDAGLKIAAGIADLLGEAQPGEIAILDPPPFANGRREFFLAGYLSAKHPEAGVRRYQPSLIKRLIAAVNVPESIQSPVERLAWAAAALRVHNEMSRTFPEEAHDPEPDGQPAPVEPSGADAAAGDTE